MITLKDITLKLFIQDGLKSSQKEQREDVQLLMDFGINNCADLYEHIKSGDSRFQKPIFLRIVSLSLDNLRKIGISKKEPAIYTFDNYDRFPTLKKVLEKSDSHVSCEELPIFTPIELNHRALKIRVEDINIARARELLGLIAPDTRNALVNLLPNLNGERLKDIANGIKFYEEQIIRIVESCPTIINYNGIIFYKDAEKKRQIIEPILEDVILYISSLGEDFIWGRLSDKSKAKLLSSVKRKSDMQKTIIESFISLITNYVTLQEMEEGIIESGVLKRFVLEPKKEEIV